MSASTSRSSGTLTADGVVVDRPTLLCGIAINAAAANVTAILYDNASAASGTVLAKLQVDSTTVKSKQVWFDRPVKAFNGIYLDISGTGAEAIVYTG